MKLGSLKTQSQALKFLSKDGGKRQNLSDSQVRGLQLERLRLGVGKWRIRTSSADGRERMCMTLGDALNLTLADARVAALKITRSIALGENPKMQRQEGKQIPTISEFIQERYITFVAGYKRSWECDRGLLKNHIETRWGKRYLDQISKADLITLFAEHRKTHAPGSCNRLLILLRYMFNLAIKWETPGISKNPTTGFPLMPEENKKERFLTKEEAQVLYEKLKLSDNAMLKFIVPMLILTGARKREVLDARWQDIDIERRSWRIHTTKLGRPRHVPLSDGAVSDLSQTRNLSIQIKHLAPLSHSIKSTVSIACSKFINAISKLNRKPLHHPPPYMPFQRTLVCIPCKKKHPKPTPHPSSNHLGQRSFIAFSSLRLGSIIIFTRTKGLKGVLFGQCPRTAECATSSSLKFCR